MFFLNKRERLRRLELRAIVIRLNSSLPAKFGDRFMFFDTAVLSQVSGLTFEMINPVLITPVRFIRYFEPR